MSKTDYDYLLVGQGIAGSVLSYFLIQAGKSVYVIDRFNPHSSSQVAAGLVNPVTGRRVVKSWMADILLPFALNFYRKIEKESGTKFYHELDVLEVVTSVKSLNDWTSRMEDPEMRSYFTSMSPEEKYKGKITEFKKLIRISNSAWMDLPLFLSEYRKQLLDSSRLVEHDFNNDDLIIEANQVTYEDLSAKNIVFCDGFKSKENKLWKSLPFLPAKGELLTIECPELPEDFILLSGIFLIPIGNHCFRTGSTYEWNFKDDLPTDNGKQKLEKLLNEFLNVPYKIIAHTSGIRPTIQDRRPLIGCHPLHKNVFLFNGLGTKGVLLAPFFADHFTEFLLGKIELMQEVDIKRFDIT